MATKTTKKTSSKGSTDREHRSVYEPAINAALTRIATALGTTYAPSRVPSNARFDAWNYLEFAVDESRASFTNATSRQNYFWLFVTNEWGNHGYYESRLVKTQADVDAWSASHDPDSDKGSPICLAHYPVEAHACLKQQRFVWGGDGSIMGIWLHRNRRKLCYIHFDSFEVVAEDAIDFIERVAVDYETLAKTTT